MTESFDDTVKTACGTELDRLAGDKVLLAATDATLEEEAVVAAIRRPLQVTAERAEDWAGVAEGEAASALEGIAAGCREADRAVRSAPDAEQPPEAPPDGPTMLALGEPETALARAGACCVGAPPILDGLGLQGVSFFVNEADTAGADRCRAVREEIRTARETAAEHLHAACADEADREAVVAGAVAAVEATYDRYAEALAGMGLDPKPIC